MVCSFSYILLFIVLLENNQINYNICGNNRKHNIKKYNRFGNDNIFIIAKKE